MHPILIWLTMMGMLIRKLNVAALSPHMEDLLRELAVSVVAKPFALQELLSTVEDGMRRIGAGAEGVGS